MKVSRLLTEVLLKKFCESLEEELNEAASPSSGLTTLLNEAKVKVFDKYTIDPKTQTYFLAGSARLHLYPKLQEVMNETMDDEDKNARLFRRKKGHNRSTKLRWE